MSFIFLVAGVSDCVRCFYCGVGISDWDECNAITIWRVHAKVSPTCQFVLKSKGEQFITYSADIEIDVDVKPYTPGRGNFNFRNL